MKHFLILAILVAVSGCSKPADQTDIKEDLKILKGVMIEKSANVKSYEAFNAPSNPYYVLDLGKVDDEYSKHIPAELWKNKHQVTLRPSKTVTTADISKFKGKQVLINPGDPPSLKVVSIPWLCRPRMGYSVKPAHGLRFFCCSRNERKRSTP